MAERDGAAVHVDLLQIEFEASRHRIACAAGLVAPTTSIWSSRRPPFFAQFVAGSTFAHDLGAGRVDTAGRGVAGRGSPAWRAALKGRAVVDADVASRAVLLARFHLGQRLRCVFAFTFLVRVE